MSYPTDLDEGGTLAMSKLTQIGRFMLAPMLALATSLMPVASGLLVMLYQLEHKLEENARVSVREGHLCNR